MKKLIPFRSGHNLGSFHLSPECTSRQVLRSAGGSTKHRLRSYATAIVVLVAFGLSLGLSIDAKASATDCSIAWSDSVVQLHVCDLSADQTWIQVEFPSAGKALNATFPNGSLALGMQAPRFWNRLWWVGGSNSISSDEQSHLRDVLAIAGAGPGFSLASSLKSADSSQARAILDFLANFVEAGQAIEPFDAIEVRGLSERLLLNDGSEFFAPKYTMICEFIGKMKNATFTAGRSNRTASILVGDKATNCRGRCGAGCSQIGQWHENQYTQECLDHDACHDETGSQLGPCKDEFWRAAAGYSTAPDCD